MPYSEKRKRYYPTLRERPWLFWQKVDDSGGPAACWEWQGCRDTRGYGRAGKTNRAHRLAYEIAFGPIPKGGYICHRCDNPPCCNPDHLFLGDARLNAIDMANKGRVRGGGPRRIDRRAVKLLVDQGMSFREVGRRLGHTHNAIAKAYRELA